MKPLLVWREVPNPAVTLPRRKFVADVGNVGWVHIEENFANPAEWDVWVHVTRRNHKSFSTQPSLEKAQLKAEKKAREQLHRLKKWIAAAELQLGRAVPTPEVVSR
jgi:hypothetical protein